jgi:hypothetical protein
VTANSKTPIKSNRFIATPNIATGQATQRMRRALLSFKTQRARFSAVELRRVDMDHVDF